MSREDARKFLIKQVQNKHFSSVISTLREDKPILDKSRLSELAPFLDEEGLLRVGGRLKNKKFPQDQMHPLLIPHKHKLAEVIVRH